MITNISEMFHDDTNIYCYNFQVSNKDGLLYYADADWIEENYPHIWSCIRTGFRLTGKTWFVFKSGPAFVQITLV